MTKFRKMLVGLLVVVFVMATLVVGTFFTNSGGTASAMTEAVPTPFATPSGIWSRAYPVCDPAVVTECITGCNAWRWPLKTCSLCYAGCSFLRPTPTPMPSNADCVWSRLTPWCQKI